MSSLADVLRTDLARYVPVAREPMDPVVRRLVREVPLRSRVLEIGCTRGVARELVQTRGAKVAVIDRDPHAIELARDRTPSSLGIEYGLADLSELAPQGFNVAIAIDVELDLEALAAAVDVGGLVLIAGRTRSMWLRAIKQQLRAVLPGVVVRRYWGGRYSAVWMKR